MTEAIGDGILSPEVAHSAKFCLAIAGILAVFAIAATRMMSNRQMREYSIIPGLPALIAGILTAYSALVGISWVVIFIYQATA